VENQPCSNCAPLPAAVSATQIHTSRYRSWFAKVFVRRRTSYSAIQVGTIFLFKIQSSVDDNILNSIFSLKPLTEFANVWVHQGSGSRLIRLHPSPSCQSACSHVEITLQAGDIRKFSQAFYTRSINLLIRQLVVNIFFIFVSVYYNWQFWNPESWPAARFKDLSLTYVGSFY
jgi:hypothetical protein